jgi:hypothetical protein
VNFSRRKQSSFPLKLRSARKKDSTHSPPFTDHVGSFHVTHTLPTRSVPPDTSIDKVGSNPLESFLTLTISHHLTQLRSVGSIVRDGESDSGCAITRAQGDGRADLGDGCLSGMPPHLSVLAVLQQACLPDHQVEDRTFHAFRHTFTGASDVFEGMFLLPQANSGEGSSKDRPIILQGCKKEDFAALMKVLHPMFVTLRLIAPQNLTMDGFLLGRKTLPLALIPCQKRSGLAR